MVCTVPPNILSSAAQTRSWCVPCNFRPSWFTWTLLMAYPTAKLESNGDKGSPCFRAFLRRNMSVECSPFSYSVAISNSKALCSGTSGSAVCISVCLTLLTQCTLNSSEKWFLHLAKVLWEPASKLPFSSFIILVLSW